MSEHEHDLFGTGLLGDALSPKRTGNLAERFLVPPFTVLSARDMYWQNRKRAWIALGIQSELGRGGDLTYTGEIAHDLDHYRHKEGTRSSKDSGKPVEGTAIVGFAQQPVTLAVKPTTFLPPPGAVQAATAPVAPAAPTVALPPQQAPVVAGPRAMRPLVPLASIHVVVPLTAKREPFEDPFLAAHRARLDEAGDAPLAFDGATWGEGGRSAVAVDVECYANFFVVCLKRISDGKRLAFERSRRAEIDRARLLEVLGGNVLVTFNGSTYDLPMIALALRGEDTASLKVASDRIVFGDGMKPWTVERELGVKVPGWNHIDLMEASPAVRQSLKVINGRLHGRFMADLPYPPEALLSPRQMNHTTLYCMDDLDKTERLYRALREPLELRVALGKQHGLDLRSKSDSQIGEVVIKKQVEAALGRKIIANPSPPTSFGYQPPGFVSFAGDILRRVLDDLRTAKFYVVGGKVTPPPCLEGLKVEIGTSTYSLGIGGIHSNESHRALRSDDEHFLLDTDVASQYPNIVMKLGIYPSAMGPTFLDVFRDLIEKRLAAKRRQQEIEKLAKGGQADDVLRVELATCRVMAEGGKIMANGAGFGKMGSPYSSLYAPDLMIAITVTGQLVILMLVERAEAAGIAAVSANTDGVVFKCPRARAAELDAIIVGWEAETGFTVERTPYRALYSASVNSYIALAEDGKVKRKGAVADPWSDGDVRGQIQKNPQMTVCSEALVRHIKDGAAFAETIRACRDPRMFVTVTRVTGGGTWRGRPLGRAVRYYWSTDGSPILAGDGKRKVAKTDGAKPLLEMTDVLPDDVDHDRYVREAEAMAVDFAITEPHGLTS